MLKFQGLCLLNSSHFNYPRIIEFIDSLTNVFLILFIPSLILLVAYMFYMAFVVSNKKNKYINATFALTFFAFLSIYIYYSFFVLDYFELLANALLSILIILVYVIFSPLFLVYLVLTSTDVELSLFLNSSIILQDIRVWLNLKFGLSIDEVTKESLIVLFKLLTLVLFSAKIINVTRFIISSVTHSKSTRDSIAAFVIFGIIFALYVFLNIEELSKIFELLLHISQSMLSGAML